MKPKSAIAKGKILEDWVAKRLQDTGLDPRAYKQKGSGSGQNKGDIWNALGISFECKNTKNFSMDLFWKQSVRDSLGTTEPCIVWHPQHLPLEDSRVVISWEYFETLLLGRNEEKEIDNRNLKWKLQDLKSRITSVLKEL